MGIVCEIRGKWHIIIGSSLRDVSGGRVYPGPPPLTFLRVSFTPTSFKEASISTNRQDFSGQVIGKFGISSKDERTPPLLGQRGDVVYSYSLTRSKRCLKWGETRN